MSRLRVGIVSYLNAWPLAWGFLEGRHADLFEASSHPPARVAELLAAGELDIGLLPSVEVQRIPDLTVLPGLCIAAVHEVRSVLLMLGKPIDQVRRVALDVNSRTSAALVQILLADRHGITPELVPAHPDPERMLAEADGALLIGDPALRVHLENQGRWQILDLAAEWRALTGHPFVFAVWAVRPQARLAGLPAYFESSLRHGLASLDAIVDRAASELSLPPHEIVEYLTHNLSYTLGAAELAGLAEFHRRCAEHGLVPASRPVSLWAA